MVVMLDGDEWIPGGNRPLPEQWEGSGDVVALQEVFAAVEAAWAADQAERKKEARSAPRNGRRTSSEDLVREAPVLAGDRGESGLKKRLAEEFQHLADLTLSN